MTYDVRITHHLPRHLAVTEFQARPEQMGELQGKAFATVLGYLTARGLAPAGPAVSRYVMRGDHFDVASGFVVAAPVEGDDTVVPLLLQETDVATTMHVGPYDELGKAYDALEVGARDQGRAVDVSAPMWEEYLSGPDVPPEQTVTLVYWPVLPLTS